jgi:hypothetical protein
MDKPTKRERIRVGEAEQDDPGDVEFNPREPTAPRKGVARRTIRREMRRELR